MTDQIPLDLAPPPLLNGEVPLMSHMVNGDAAQQVNTHIHVCHLHSVILLQNDRRLSTFPRADAKTQSCTPSLLSFRHMAHVLLSLREMNSCPAVTVKHWEQK